MEPVIKQNFHVLLGVLSNLSWANNGSVILNLNFRTPSKNKLK